MVQNPVDPSALFLGLGAIWLVFGVIALAATVFWIIELVDVARRQFSDPTMKIVWLLIILLCHVLGALIYFFVGKPQGSLPGQGFQGPRPGGYGGY